MSEVENKYNDFEAITFLQIDPIDWAILKNKYLTVKITNLQDFLDKIRVMRETVYYNNIQLIYFRSGNAYAYEIINHEDLDFINKFIAFQKQNK